MDGETLIGNLSDELILRECCLCGKSNNTCVDVLTIQEVISIKFIHTNIGLKLNEDDVSPNLLCDVCIRQITDWQNFVHQCQNVRNERERSKNSLSLLCDKATEVINSIPETDPEAEQLTDVQEIKDTVSEKKSRFTLEYLENKISRPLEEKEVDHLQKLINKGEDRGIFAFLFGSGTNQSWPCQLCSLVIKGTMKEVSKHYLNEHQASPLFPCQLCGKVIKSMHTYKRHRTAHLSEYKCSSCDKVFQDRSKLLAHRVSHSDSRPHVCGICGKQYKLASHLKSHRLRVHVPESDRLAFTCEICGKRFSAKGNLTTHVQTTHSDQRPYVCELCGKGVKTKQALQFHLNSHSGIKQFSCTMCSMTFTSRSSLASHTRIHTGERPYLCQQCGKSFTSSSARSSHRLHVHATSRQHACSMCDKSFKVLRDLKVHQSIHTGEKPHVCPVCGKAFRVAANFYAHRKTHRKAAEKEANRSLDAAVAEIGEFIQVNQQQQQQQQEDLHTLQMAQPINDALSQAIQEHLTQSLVGEEPLSSFVINQQQQQQQQQQQSAPILNYNSATDVIDYTSIHAEHSPGYLKQILMGQFDK